MSKTYEEIMATPGVKEQLGFYNNGLDEGMSRAKGNAYVFKFDDDYLKPEMDKFHAWEMIRAARSFHRDLNIGKLPHEKY